MPVTTLDPSVALVVIDLQKGIAVDPRAHPVAPVVANAVALLDAFRARELPVVLVNVTGGTGVRTDQSAARAAAGAGVGAGGRTFPDDFAELIPELDARTSDILVTKRTVGAFTGTDLEERLRERGVTQLVVVGIATSAGVESTVRAAADLGFHVSVATDACTDTSIAGHEASVSAGLPRFAETGTTAEVLALLPALAR
ncbi:isochorismatase family protein [Schumannella luteola]|uniref:Nicotinamidase-related amidase n=1 Tax=Schumannella luteola TaxID=472059 RepID=A0A852YG68_9MICO|nr:isochorismatase family cysteine hydrolase [Schumannella luteola]NYH00743.1 nicotinamidase-related amidase [Schumannella luteola]TPX03955.1 cysteine hydrolase [Schumannella luteola]